VPEYFEIKLTEKEPFLNAMKNRILLFDGAMGTEIQKYDLLLKTFQIIKMDSMMV